MGPIAHAVCYLRLYTGEWSSPMWALTRVQAPCFFFSFSSDVDRGVPCLELVSLQAPSCRGTGGDSASRNSGSGHTRVCRLASRSSAAGKRGCDRIDGVKTGQDTWFADKSRRGTAFCC